MRKKYYAVFQYDTWNYSANPFAKIIYEPPIGYILEFSGVRSYQRTSNNWWRGISPEKEQLYFRSDSLSMLCKPPNEK
jgi:hypothetical protein